MKLAYGMHGRDLLRIFLASKGYTPDPSGNYTNVTINPNELGEFIDHHTWLERSDEAANAADMIRIKDRRSAWEGMKWRMDAWFMRIRKEWKPEQRKLQAIDKDASWDDEKKNPAPAQEDADLVIRLD